MTNSRSTRTHSLYDLPSPKQPASKRPAKSLTFDGAGLHKRLMYKRVDSSQSDVANWFGSAEMIDH